MKSLEIVSTNISTQKGTIKKPVEKIFLNETGIRDDAHAGNWNRQVSLLAEESIRDFQVSLNREIAFGEFAENITTKGFRLNKVHPLDRLKHDAIEMIVTQIGKKCHGTSCEIFKQVGDCVMPREGIFARVEKGGWLQSGMILEHLPKTYQIKIITLSDRAYNKIYEDKSGPLVKNLLQKFFREKQLTGEFELILIDDNPEKLRELVLQDKSDILITTGGTGIGPKDITPDTLAPLLDKEIPGIMEMVRCTYGKDKPNALVSRSIAGTRNTSLIYALPGSTKAVKEYLEIITPTLLHSVYMLHGLDMH